MHNEQLNTLNMKTTVVKNLVTGEKEYYVNDKSLTENIVNSIIFHNNQTSQLLNEDVRNSYRELVKEGKSRITGNNFAFCIEYDLHAKFE